MSKYTTGEIAKLCSVSVRTVQYYDSRNILVPSELSEGGRRLYSEDDLKKMKTICFLREVGLSINNISRLLKEDNFENVLSVILDEHQKFLEEEMNDIDKKLKFVEEIKSELKNTKRLSVESIGDIAQMMKNKRNLAKLRWGMVIVGIIMEIIEIGTAVLWWKTGIWWPFALGMCVVIGLGIWISLFYFKRVAYICPECHEVYKPKLKNAFFAYHTPNTRKLTSPKYNHKGYCVEIYSKNEKKESDGEISH